VALCTNFFNGPQQNCALLSGAFINISSINVPGSFLTKYDYRRLVSNAPGDNVASVETSAVFESTSEVEGRKGQIVLQWNEDNEQVAGT
jgi:hypothetical protein